MILPDKKNIGESFREVLWSYPDSLFARGGLLHKIFSLFRSLMPFSYIFTLSIVFALFGFFYQSSSFNLVNMQQETLVEGVIVGDVGITRINPLIPTNKQVENDLANLIYLPLVRVKPSGEVDGVLATDWEAIDGEKSFDFSLRDDVYWHDGSKFTTDDVIATFEVLTAIGGEGKTIVSKNAELALNSSITKTGEYSFVIRLDEITPTFFEDLSFGILPRHILNKVNLSTFSWDPFNMRPVGTGPFVFKSYTNDTIELTRNEEFFGELANLKSIQIKLYETGDDAVNALKTGEIHTLVDPSSAIVENLEGYRPIEIIRSNNLYRRYLAVYFNLKSEGPEVFKEKEVRQAISSAIDVEAIIAENPTAGSQAKGPIPENSWAFNEEVERYNYNPDRSRELLNSVGWEEKKLDDKVVRMKDDEILRFNLAYLNKYDREKVAESIKSDLAEIGIIVNLDPRGTSDLNEALIATRNFEAVLYGVETPIDPDRIRLWHTKAIDYPGLNIASYVSDQTRSVVGEDQQIEQLNLVDIALENARSTTDRESRIGDNTVVGYDRFQEILLDEVPVVFLYHPVFVYVARDRVKGIDMKNMTAPEDRYDSIAEWYID